MQVPLRLYEIDVSANTIASKQSAEFGDEFTRTVEQLLASGARDDDPRAAIGMNPEPYRPSSDIQTDPVALRERARSIYLHNKTQWQWLYSSLSDDPSRRTLVLVLAYRALGWRYVRLPLDNERTRNAVAEISTHGLNEDLPQAIKAKGLQRFHLEAFGRNLTVFSDPFGVFNEFVYPQYSYRGMTDVYGPSKGDYVLDCGACYGGSTLNFCDIVGTEGRVYSFEFEKENTAVYRWNIHENPGFLNRVCLVERPVWSSSDQVMQVTSAGPASQVSTGNAGEYTVSSITIDDFVFKNGLPKMDFIKMDIEGAEVEALKGAIKVIEKYKPKLAICIYHKLTDFLEVPRLIKGVRDDYQLYISHNSTHGDETVLFAI
jgi:FkbM family methyltransferase